METEEVNEGPGFPLVIEAGNRDCTAEAKSTILRRKGHPVVWHIEKREEGAPRKLTAQVPQDAGAWRHSRRAAKLGWKGWRTCRTGDQVTHGRIRHSELAQKRTRVKGAIEKHACYRLLQNCPVGQLGEVYASSSKALSTARKPTMTLQGSQDKALAGILPQP